AVARRTPRAAQQPRDHRRAAPSPRLPEVRLDRGGDPDPLERLPPLFGSRDGEGPLFTASSALLGRGGSDISRARRRCYGGGSRDGRWGAAGARWPDALRHRDPGTIQDPLLLIDQTDRPCLRRPDNWTPRRYSWSGLVKLVKTVNLYEAKTRLSRLVEEAAKGEEIVIAKAGRSLARLVPMGRSTKPRKPGA